MKRLVLSFWLILLISALATGTTTARKPGLYAVFDTSMGTFVCELYQSKAPITVKNFVDLAEGKKEWLNQKGDTMANKPYYNGLLFYRIIKGFMIQSGSLNRAGNFPAIVPFEDEIEAALRFDKPGVLAMANSGANTNRTQFFVTVAAQPHLNGKHTIFGRVVEGMDVVQKINQVPTTGDRPNSDVILNKVTIERIGK
jgi:peptidyl-prolyl cis-trans isomerase A (cyclophilin A)